MPVEVAGEWGWGVGVWGGLASVAAAKLGYSMTGRRPWLIKDDAGDEWRPRRSPMLGSRVFRESPSLQSEMPFFSTGFTVSVLFVGVVVVFGTVAVKRLLSLDGVMDHLLVPGAFLAAYFLLYAVFLGEVRDDSTKNIRKAGRCPVCLDPLPGEADARGLTRCGECGARWKGTARADRGDRQGSL